MLRDYLDITISHFGFTTITHGVVDVDSLEGGRPASYLTSIESKKKRDRSVWKSKLIQIVAGGVGRVTIKSARMLKANVYVGVSSL